MIAGLKGKLEALSSDWGIVDVGGVSFRVYMPTSTISALGRVGIQVRLHTHLHLREDNVALYGFASEEELALFQILITVSGVGPRLALAMLSAMNVDQLSMAIATGNTDLLTDIPGIGKKTANRIILELKDKIGAGWVASTAAQVVQDNADVISALTSLGYSVSEATRAVTALPSSSKLKTEEKIKLALQYFGGK